MPMTRPTPRNAASLLFTVIVASTAVWCVPAAAAPWPTSTVVRYDVTGSGAASYITYQTLRGQQHATNVTLPWSVQYTDMVASTTTSAAHMVSAQTAGPGSLTCTVSLDGKVVARNTASGDPARVMCENHDPPDPGTTPPTPSPTPAG